jgi:ubiquinone/menaquinone biosynthesis C-methylase UbiE
LPNIQFIKAPAEWLPFKNSRFDVVVCVNALDHFDDCLQAVKEMERVLKQGGLLFLNVDCKDRRQDRLEKQIGHPYRFTSEKLRDLFKCTKLDVIFENEIASSRSVTVHFKKS